MSDINKGDKVQLKSGGPPMTAQEVGDFLMHHGIENGVLCVWFDGKTPMEKVFDQEVLKPVRN